MVERTSFHQRSMSITLSIEWLMSVLRESSMSGSIEAPLPPGFSGLPHACVIRVILHQGQMTSCVIHSQQAVFFEGRDVLTKIARLSLDWTVTETTTASPGVVGVPTPSATGLSVAGFVPEEAEIASLVPLRRPETKTTAATLSSRTARNIYGLINGTNTVKKIANLLSLSLAVVYAELQALNDSQLILLTSASLS